jgi:phosphoglycerate-specific signal transduction histidine kinase
MGGGKGKACKNMRTLYILRSGEAMPIQLSLPPTSLRPFTDFMNSVFVTRQRPTSTAIVQIGLKRQDNGTNQYSVATFRKIADLTQEQLIQMRQYASNFRAQAKEMQQQRALEAVNRAAGDESFDAAAGFHSDGDGEHFVLTGTINGDTGALPM